MIAFLLPSTMVSNAVYLQATHLFHSILLFPCIIAHALTLEEECTVFKPVYFIQLNRYVFILLHLVLFLYLHRMCLTLLLAFGGTHL